MQETSKTRELSGKGIAVGAAVGAAAGAVGNLLVFAIAKAASVPMAGQLRGPDGPVMDVQIANVIGASFVPAVAAALFALVLNATTKRPSRILVVASAVFGVLSMMGPVNLGGADAGTKVVLALMHVVSGIAIPYGILRFGRR